MDVAAPAADDVIAGQRPRATKRSKNASQATMVAASTPRSGRESSAAMKQASALAARTGWDKPCSAAAAQRSSVLAHARVAALAAPSSSSSAAATATAARHHGSGKASIMRSSSHPRGPPEGRACSGGTRGRRAWGTRARVSAPSNGRTTGARAHRPEGLRPTPPAELVGFVTDVEVHLHAAVLHIMVTPSPPSARKKLSMAR